MRGLLTILIVVFIYPRLTAQQGDYQKSVAAYQELKTDSALMFINRAIQHFQQPRQTDSLVFAYEYKSDIIWREQGIPAGLAIVDSALQFAAELPDSSTALVAILNKKGQILLHNMEAAKGKKFLLQALGHVIPAAPPNDVYATLYNNLSWLYLELQDFTPALQYAEKARKITESLHGKDARKLVSIYQSLCLITHDAGMYDQSEKYGLEMYRLAKMHFSAHHPSLGLMHNDLGTLYESMHRFDEALFHRRKMVEIIQYDYQKNKNPQLLAIAYNNMGNLYEMIGEFYLSNEYFEKARKLHEINYGVNSAGIVRPLTHLANAKRSLGIFDEAGRLYRQAYSLQQQYGGDDRLNLGYVEAQYGDLFYDKKQYDTAAVWYLKALDDYRKAGISSTSIVESTRATLGESYARLNRTSEALVLLNDGLKSYRKTYPAGHIVLAGQYNKISEAWLIDGNLLSARDYSDSVFLELLQVKQISGNNWLEKLPYNYHITHYLKTRIAILNALYKKSAKIVYQAELLQLVEDYGRYLEKGMPALRTQTSLIDLAAQNKSLYNSAIEACWEMNKKDSSGGYMEKAFELSERSKALLLRLAANNLMVDANRVSHDPTALKDVHLRSLITALNEQYLNSEKKNDSLLTLLTATMETYRVFQDSLLLKGNKEAQLKYRLLPFKIREIREQLLTGDQTLIQYSVTDNYVFVFVVTHKNFRVHRLPKKALEDVKLLRQLHGLSPEEFSQPAYRLYRQLIAPVEKDFGSKRLLIVPDAELYYLNFELLVTAPGKTDFAKMDYLLKKYNISYLLSAASAIQFKVITKANTGRALLLAPVFTDAMKEDYKKGMRDSVLSDDKYLTLLRQPFVLQAAHDIGRYIKNDLFAEQNALESAFKRSVGGYGILHLGTHAEINNGSPLQSRFFLAKPLASDTMDSEDGYLNAYEIYAMHIRAELAVLTACETGNGEWRNGEGAISLAHSFMYAGCPSVVMSLWKIDEKTSAGIITQFYKYLSEGMYKSEALRKAKLHYLKNAELELQHPYYWAGLNLIGDDSAVYRRSYRWVWLLLATILAGLAGVIVFRRKRFPQLQ